jgi:hypothetical protein
MMQQGTYTEIAAVHGFDLAHGSGIVRTAVAWSVACIVQAGKEGAKNKFTVSATF